MSRIGLGLALENEEVVTDLVPDDVTQDELDQAPVEEVEAAGEIQDAMDDAEKGLDVAASLESIRVVLFGKTELSQTEHSLLRIAGEMAVAGMPVTQPLIAFESADVGLALEGIGDRVRSIITSIVQGFSKIIAKLKDWAKRIAFRFKSVEGKIKVVRQRIAAMKAEGKTKTAELTVSARASLLGPDGKTVKSMGDAIKNMQVVAKSNAAVIKAVVENAKSLDADCGMLELIKDLASVEKTAVAFFKNTYDLSQAIVKGAGLARTGGTAQYDVYTSKQGPVSIHTELRVPKLSSSEMDDYKAIRGVGKLFNATINADLDVINDADSTNVFTNVSLDDLDKFLTALEESYHAFDTYVARLESIFESTSRRLEGSVSAVLLVIGTSIGGAATALATTAKSAAVTAGAAFVGGAAPGAAVGVGNFLIGELIFSYKMLMVNNRMIGDLIFGTTAVTCGLAEDGVIAINKMLSKGRWE